ncbi:hypothetical protein MRB53_016348 [Persea americana]|uniref:Uncharacterized protein n=1 Tax=Persea americana TaxID=3435 RepID=A0ACC2M1S5_PERAE|nr:hypothetical protein MRB53_016348 [Persea americana]
MRSGFNIHHPTSQARIGLGLCNTGAGQRLRELNEAQEGGPSNSIGDDIYTQVMGTERHGRVRGYGLGPTPRSVFGSTPGQSRTNVEEMRVELNVVHNRMEELMKRDEDRNAYLEELQREQQRMHTAMADMMRQLSDQQQNSFEEGADRNDCGANE